MLSPLFRWIAASTLTLLLLAACSEPAPTPVEPQPGAEAIDATPEATPERAGLTAAEVLALDEGASYGVAQPEQPVLESVAPTEAAPAEASSAPTEAVAPPPSDHRPTPTPRPYRFVGWEEGADGFERVAKEHDERHKAVVIYFRADWCGYCKRLERDYLAHPLVAGWLRNTPKVHINPEDGDAEMEIARMFRVRGYPTFAVMPPNTTWGTRYHPFRQGGEDQTPAEFLADLKAAAEGGG